MILNGCFGKKSEWTYIGEKGVSTIDLDAKIENLEKKTVRKESEREKGRKIMRNDWSEEGIRHYHKNCESWRAESKDVENIWREIKEKTERSIKKEKRKIKR